jgi:Protein of unknown function (DUF4038)/Domain of unknown function (DUF5060)
MKPLPRPKPMIARVLPATLFVAMFGPALPSTRAAEPIVVEANRVAEVTFTSTTDRKDPFNEVELDVVFTGPDRERMRVPAFWGGGRQWRVRFASPQAGTFRYVTDCSDRTDKGLHGVSGEVGVRPYLGDNPLYRHGPLRVAADHRHLEHLDGTPFFWLGDTWWMGLCERLEWPDGFRTLAADRRAKGFNVIQIVAGLYPDMPAFDDRGRNEAGFPWEKDYSRIRPEYFDKADERLTYLADQGFVPCIVGAWGYHLPWLGVERMKKHMRYLAARYGALPVVWCAAGEVNLPYYLEKGFPLGGEKQAADWEGVIRHLRDVNAFNRPVTVHPTGLPPLSGRLLYRDQGLLDFDMLQTGHGQREVLAPTIKALHASYGKLPHMPVLNGEVCYEALLGTIPAEIPRLMFWTNILSGAAGHTYGANGIWQLNRPGHPYGKSPHGGNYGTIPWDEAMKLPGSGQLGLAKALFEEYPWHRFEPHPEWAAWTRAGSRGYTWGDWIWYPEGDPTRDAPVASRFFRKTFDLPPGKRIDNAVLRLTVDDQFTAYLNGRSLGTHGNWKSGREFADIADALRPGRNVLAVRGENGQGPKNANPAGLACNLEISLEGGETIVVLSDGTWRCATTGRDGWQEPAFDDSTWESARIIAHSGEGPWGAGVGEDDEFQVPYTAGIPGSVRVVYLPRMRSVTIRNLEPGQSFIARVLDPVSGRRSEIGPVRPDAAGTWTTPPPRGMQGDWVLVLEASQPKP